MTTEPTRRSQRTPSDDEIPSLLEALETFGGSTAAFAREQGLAAWKLYKARRAAAGAGPGRRRRRRRKDGPDFVPVQVVVERPASSVPLELVLGSDRRLLIPSGFDETTLRRVMEVLVSC
jgi:hypothetical protein